MPHVWNHPAGEEQEQWSGGTHGYGGITGFYGEGLEYPGQATGECPPGQVWNARWNECQTAPPNYYPSSPSEEYDPGEGGGNILLPEDNCTNQGGIWNSTTGECEFPPASEEVIYNEFNCIPGKRYTDAQGNPRYCPLETDTGGRSFEESWSAQGNPLLEVLSRNPEFLQNFDMQEIMGMFPDMSPEDFDIAREELLNTMGSFRQEKGVQRRTIGDILRGSAMESGQQLASSGFAGGGAYGMQAGKERKKTLRDYRQSMQDINLSMAETESGFQEDVEAMRYEYGEEVADIMAGIYGTDMTDWAADEQCGEGQIFWGGQCTFVDEIDIFADYAEDIFPDYDWG